MSAVISQHLAKFESIPPLLVPIPSSQELSNDADTMGKRKKQTEGSFVSLLPPEIRRDIKIEHFELDSMGSVQYEGLRSFVQNAPPVGDLQDISSSFRRFDHGVLEKALNLKEGRAVKVETANSSTLRTPIAYGNARTEQFLKTPY